MRTTSLFAEILIIGVQSSIWIGLAFYPILKDKWDKIVHLPGEMYVLLSIIALGIFYSIGIVIERLGGIVIPVYIATKLSKKNRWFKSKVKQIDICRVDIHFKEGSLSQFLEFTLGRIRIVRATMVNLLITSSLGIYLTIRGNIVLWGVLGTLVFILVGALLLLALLAITLMVLLATYESFLKRSIHLLEGISRVTGTEREP